MDGVLDTFEACKKRWLIDEELDNSFLRYPEWLEKMPEELAEIVNSLMPGFDYYNHHSVNERLKMLYEELQQIETVDFENTFYSVLHSQDERCNSSYEYLLEYKSINGISKYVVIPNLKEKTKEDLDHIENIVFVDDFCGTGKTFKDYIESVKDIIKDKHIYYSVIHIMDKAAKKIERYAEDNNLKIHILCQTCTPKAFERKTQMDERRADFKRLSIEYGLPGKNVLGYNKAEALVAFFSDTPNDTLEIFWRDTDNNKAIFSRVDDEKPEWQKMKKNKKNRSASNYLKGSRQ